MTRNQIYWCCQLGGWLTVACVYFLTSLMGEVATSVMRLALVYGANSMVALACTHAYRAVIRRWGWARLPLLRLLPRALVASLGLGLAMTVEVVGLEYLTTGESAGWLSWAPFLAVGWTSTMCLWSAAYFAVHYVERIRQLEIERLQLAVVAKDAQLQGLVAQLQPHFLFNCLNSVRGLIAEDPAKAQATVTQLSDLLRYALQATKSSTVSLETELEMVRTYLALETVRFEERLRSELDIAGDALALPVPAMLVQSLVENGVKHGIERVRGGGTIRVVARRDDRALRIAVESPGALAASPASTQIGLANARERLRLLYGGGATLELCERAHGVVAEVAIPLAEGARTP